MKKSLLFLTSFALLIGVHAQNNALKPLKQSTNNRIDNISSSNAFVEPTKSSTQRVASSGITVKDIGKAGNAFGTAFGAKTNIWADPRINSVIMVHRSTTSGTGSDANVGFLRYDVSKNGGTDWTNMIGPVYSPNGDPQGTLFSVARYPQAVIYNPSGNTSPDNAYMAFFAPTRDNSNPFAPDGDWGGHGFGVHKLSGADAPISHEVHSVPGTKKVYEIANAMTITQQGKIFHVDAMRPGSDSYHYHDSLIINVGVFNSTTHDVDYTESYIPAPVTRDLDNLPNFTFAYSVAFGPDGNTGYIVMLGHNSYTLMPDSNYYPIVYKTINGGATWDTTAINVDLAAAHVGDSLPAPTNGFTTGFDVDLVVDSLNNPHIVCPVGVGTNGFSIASAQGNFGIFDIHSTDGGATWKSSLLGFPANFRGTFGDASTANPTITEDNRPQAATNFTGSKLFFTWQDAGDTASTADNSSPDLYINAYSLRTNTWSGAKNVTGTSDAALDARFSNVSHYVFEDANGLCTVPVVIVQMNSDSKINTGDPVQLQYLEGISFKDDLSYVAGINSPKTKATGSENISVFNAPNPFQNNTTLYLNIEKSTSIQISVFNVLGEIISDIDYGVVSSGMHSILFSRNQLSSGIYFYTVKSGSNFVTKKMIIE